MKAILPLLAALLSAPFLSAADGRPNLLFLYLDDFGWKDTSYMGSDFYETPNLDRIAAQGMVFTHAYSASSNCAPPRASLLSGQYSPRHEIYNVGTQARGVAQHRRLQHVPGVDVLDPEISTWAQQMQKSGYKTAILGKWHLSQNPLPYGFDVNIAGTHSGSPPRGYYPPHPGVPGLGGVKQDEYLTDTLNERAGDFIRDHADRPWVLYLSHFAVHTPLDERVDLVPKYEAKVPGELHRHVAMATMIEAVDEGIGKVVEALEESGARERTIVVFSSDNGGYGPATSMAPLRGYKGTYYEGGIRVPLFVNWPGVVEPGGVCEIPVTGVDLYPTFCEMLGVELPADQPRDGVSLVPLLKGEVDSEGLANRAIFWHFPAYLQSYGRGVGDDQRDPLFRSRPVSVVREGDWKLIENFECGELELYQLAEDVGEKNNLSEAMPEKAAEMKAILEAWRETIGAPVPSERNPEFDEEIEKRAMRRAREG